jgi:putative oxygen-independent coproporphyrinogen III oxidase
MPSALPEGDPAPADGRLPAAALAGLGRHPWGVYVHVPYCRVRCGYCDFNTYALAELGTGQAAADAAGAGGPADYVVAVLAELDLARAALGPGAPAVDTVFLGGGTPTLLPAADLGRVLDGIRERWGVAAGAEVTCEANPDTLTPSLAQELAAAGYTRVSLGMQSAVPHVLATLERTHDPAGVAAAVGAARTAGLAVSLDLIYGTPGESIDDWRRSLAAAIDLGPDHVSAYALVVEDGTRLAVQVRRGEVAPTDDDDEAAKYEVADAELAAAGYEWYEVSSWARTESDRCRHNLGYWGDGDWWGAGPGAHSHVGGVRWWNVKHPAAYRDRVLDGRSPAAARETLTADQRSDERVLLGIRLAEGLPLGALTAHGRRAVAELVAEGLLDGQTAVRDARARLTLRGRLLADTVVRRLVS